MIFTLNLRTLRPLRLCGRYSEFRLRLSRTGFFVVSLLLFSLSSLAAEQANPHVVETGPSDKLILPPPNATRAVANPASVIPWPKEKTPTAPAGFEVSLFADDLDNPRM